MSAADAARVQLMGVEIDRLTQREAIRRIMGELEAGRGGRVVTPNLEQLRLASRGGEAARLVEDADIAVADGMPLVWASRLAGDPLPERVAGSDLLFSLSEAAASSARIVCMLGGAPGAGAQAAEKLRQRNPALEVSALPLSLGFDPQDPRQVERVGRELGAVDPDIVFVALGFPKQEQLIVRLRAVLPRSWFLGVGISLSFAAGEVARAPSWLRKFGLEWAHRLVQEPRRLYRRYLIQGIPFALRLFAHALGTRLRRSFAGGPLIRG